MEVIYLLNVDTMASTTEDQARFHCLRKTLCLEGNFLLILAREVDKVIILGTNQERNGSLVETTALAIPFFDRIERALACQIKHEQNGNSVIADQWQHIDEFALTTQIPDGESDFRIPDRNGLFHEVDTYYENCPLECPRQES